MQRYHVLRFLVLLALIGLLAACAAQPPAVLQTPTAPSREVVVALPIVLAEPQRWSGKELTLIAPVRVNADERVLTLALTQKAATATASSASGIWLAGPLPDDIRSKLKGNTGVLKLRGELSPPGAYGREQRFPYQFTAASIAVLQSERTTLVNLAENPRALDRILLRVEGTLLAQRDSALLVDQVSEGGVPLAGGHQIKLSREQLEPGFLQSLSRSGDVRWGQVEVVGWWQDGTLTPFEITIVKKQ